MTALIIPSAKIEKTDLDKVGRRMQYHSCSNNICGWCGLPKLAHVHQDPNDYGTDKWRPCDSGAGKT